MSGPLKACFSFYLNFIESIVQLLENSHIFNIFPGKNSVYLFICLGGIYVSFLLFIYSYILSIVDVVVKCYSFMLSFKMFCCI